LYDANGIMVLLLTCLFWLLLLRHAPQVVSSAKKRGLYETSGIMVLLLTCLFWLLLLLLLHRAGGVICQEAGPVRRQRNHGAATDMPVLAAAAAAASSCRWCHLQRRGACMTPTASWCCY
jgi:type VI protein secretion system component VasK